MIEVKALCAGYGGDDVIRNINLKAVKGECLCILGPNGCGKSTLLKSIARIIDYRGSVLLEGRDLSTFSRREMAKKLALLGQSVSVFFPYTIYQTTALGRYAHSEGFSENLSADDTAIVEETLKKLDIWDIRHRMIDELSGGQLQRVFLAMTVAQNPEVILLDEPTSHLDLKYQIDLLGFLKSWIKENNKTLIGVFHDLNMARNFGDTALIMSGGQVTARGTVEEALNSNAAEAAYGMDIRGFMLESLEKWKPA
ncbi:MAG: ABC transporter ATP-binding protein [Treponema sp.]|jgi:iron complex transport system ATP-binding protein|nr:ABC transporter ATP-binding protein [Treponema sp.]